MKINNVSSNYEVKKVESKKVDKKEQENLEVSNKTENNSYNINLSDAGKQAYTVEKIAQQVKQDQSYVDMDKVNKIKEQIANGQFKINAEKIADKLLDESRNFVL